MTAPGQVWADAASAMSLHAAVLDANGVILTVNRPWRRFGEENGFAWPDGGVGAEYLSACIEGPGEESVRQAIRGMRAVLEGRRETFEIDYPCPGPDGDRWYRARACRFEHQGHARVLVTHGDVTEEMQLQIEQAASTEFLQRAVPVRETQELVGIALEWLQRTTCFGVVGIRLHGKREDPYYELGVDAEGAHVPERRLCEVERRAPTLLHALEAGGPHCICARMLQGSLDLPGLSASPFGSRWTNRLLEWLDATAPVGEACRACLGENTESLLLLPLTVGTRVLGFAQLADPRRDLLDVPAVERLERVAASLAGALARTRALETLREVESLHSTAERIAHLGHWEIEFLDGTGYWSRETYRIFGRDPGTFAPHIERLLPLSHLEDRKRLVGAFEAALRSGAGVDLDCRISRPDGTERAIEMVGECQRNESGDPVRLVGTVRDVTEERRARDEIEASRHMLRRLATQLSLTEERERQRFARVLHDEIGQSLALAMMRLGTASQKEEVGALRELAADVRELLGGVVHVSRSLTFELSPPILHYLGFEQAIEWLCEERAEATGVAIECVRGDENLVLDEARRTFLYRATQELVLNCLKHASPDRIRVVVGREGDVVRIRVEDDGRGLVTLDPRSGYGYGLLSVRERLHGMGGEMEIHAADGGGTHVTIRAPLGDTREEPS